MFRPLRMVVISILFAIASIGQAEEADNINNITRIIFLYDNQEYSADSLEKSDISNELKHFVQPGDSVGYRRYEGTKLIEDVSGLVTEDGQIVFSNGIGYSADGKTVYEALMKLRETLSILLTPNFGYIK